MPQPSRVLNRETFQPGHILMTEGEQGTAAWFVERGKIQIYKKDAQGKKTILAELGPDSIIGEMAMISKEPRSATAEVLEESVLVKITAHDFEEKLKNTDRALQAVMKVLIDRLRQANEALAKRG
jgi:CRP/FNR family cyclic AMP-dependent transcriptional regulator